MALSMLSASSAFAGQAAVRAPVQPQMGLSELKDLAKQQVTGQTLPNSASSAREQPPMHPSQCLWRRISAVVAPLSATSQEHVACLA